MGAIIDGDVSIDASGNIRWTGAATTNLHSVLEFIQFMMDKQDDDQAAGDILLDITVDTPFDRSTDQIVALNSPFNIDDTFATHLYDGSVNQNDGDDLYSGLEVIGPVESGTEYIILQDNKVLPAFWGTGINPVGGASLVFSRHLVKSRSGGADIDGKRITVLARELNDTYKRFPATLGTGNAVAAISNGDDIFNNQTDVALAALTDVVNQVEGFQELNIDGTGASGQEFYSKWTKGAQNVNDVYEVTKFNSQRSHVADSGTDTATDFIIDNGTILGQAHEFSATALGEMLTAAKFQIKIGSEVGGLVGSVYCELYDSDEASPAAPTGAVLGRSESILVSAFTTTYEEILFRFNRLNPDDGSDQRSGLTLVADQEYFIAIKHDDGDADDYLEVDGDTTGISDDGNRAALNGGWVGASDSALWFTVYSSPVLHGVAGETFEGINIEVGYDGEAAAGMAENDIAIWGTLVNYGSLGGTFQEGEYVIFETASVIQSGGKVLFDDGSANMVVALDTVGTDVIESPDDITGLISGATATVTTATDEELTGGEAIVLAIDDNTGTGELYIQVISGSNPVNDNRIRSASTTDPLTDYVDATATLNTRTLVPEFVGTSTGSNIIGAYGIGYLNTDVGENDLFRSLDNSPRQPPNLQDFSVIGLVSGEDYVLVGPRTGSALMRGQFLLDGALTSATQTTILIKDGAEDGTPLSLDIPKDGSTLNTRLRVELDSGIYFKQAYTNHSVVEARFEIPSTDYSGTGNNGAADGNNAFIAFIDVLADASTELYNAQFVSSRDLFVRVRDGGGTPIKTFESITAQFLGTAQTVAATRTPDA